MSPDELERLSADVERKSIAAIAECEKRFGEDATRIFSELANMLNMVHIMTPGHPLTDKVQGILTRLIVECAIALKLDPEAATATVIALAESRLFVGSKGPEKLH